MNDDQIQIFLQVADSGSFSRAESGSYLSKQAMLKQINHLEAEVGCKLLTRDRRGTGLTEAGKIFYQGILKLQAEREELIGICRRAADEKPVIRIGTVEHQVILSPVNGLYMKKYPDVQLKHVVHPNHSGEWRVEHDIQDVAETSSDYGMDNLNPTYIPLVRSHCVAAMDPRHPLAKETSLSLRKLSDYHTMCYIMLGNEKIEALKLAFREHADHLHIRMDIDNQAGAAYECVSTDQILLTANPFIHSIAELVTIPLDNDWSREYGMIYREPVTLQVRNYIDLAVRYYTQNFPNGI